MIGLGPKSENLDTLARLLGFPESGAHATQYDGF